MKESDMYPYQKYNADFIVNNRYALLNVDMGLGKTVSTLTAINTLIFDRAEVNKVLVIAPKLVAQTTWIDEIAKWEHLRHLRVSVVVGTAKQREEALATDADIYTINRENVDWLTSYYKKPDRFPFDMVVVDELSSFKSPSAKRFKALRKVRPYLQRTVGLTGTFNPNGYLDIWSQMYLIDMGERLGRRYTDYRGTYFYEGRRNGHVVYEYKLREGADKQIQDKIADITVAMKSDDYLQLPDRIYHYVKVKLTAKELKAYKDFEKEKLLELKDGVITAVNAGVLSNKLLQYANGAVYDEDKRWHEIHNQKIEMLKELVESAGSPVMVAYAYEHDLVRIREALKEYEPKMLNTSEDIKAWNEGRVRVMLVHPASAGHGHNLQFGGHTIIWFGNTFNLELYLQLNKRLHRQGQKNPVNIYHLITEGTHDEDVIKAINKKEEGQASLVEALKTRIKNLSK